MTDGLPTYAYIEFPLQLLCYSHVNKTINVFPSQEETC